MKIVIVDDHPLVRKGLSFILSIESDIEVVGEASTIDDAVDIINKSKPDQALIDLKLGNQCGLDIPGRINRNEVNCKFTILTSSVDENDFRMAEEAGVDGYVLKEALTEEILYAIRIISKGRKYYDLGVFELAMNKKDDGIIEALTGRERDVLIALGNGMINKEIAKTLCITEYTVKKHVSQILAKLNLTDRTQAALYANKRGLVRN